MTTDRLTIGMNGSMLDEQPSGVGVYSFNVINNLNNLYSRDEKAELTVFTPTRDFLDKDIKIIKLSGLMQSSRYGKLAAFSRFCWNTFIYHFRARNYDLLISTTTHGSFLLKNQVITIHDLLSLHFDNISFHQRIYFKYLLPLLVARSTLVITVSETSKRDIIHFLKCPEEKVKVAYNGYDSGRYYPLSEPTFHIDSKFGARNYFLAIGPTYPHKNFELLIDVYSQLDKAAKRKHPLVIAGGKKKYLAHLKQYVKSIGAEEYIYFIGYVPIDLMPSLYREAFALIFPSLYEGFGIPLLEAMACGCPVISSDTSSMPEVCGDAALYFNPYDKKALFNAIHKMLTDETARRELREMGLKRSKKFSWKQTAESLKTIIETHFHTTNS